ncbi:MAG: AI-2E family transporter [Rhodospirillales bacterium]
MGAQSRINANTIFLTAGLLLLGYLLGDVLLLVFAGVLLAVVLDGMASAASGRLSVSRGWMLAGFTIGLVSLLIATFSLSATRLIEQFQALIDTMIDFVEKLHTQLSDLGVLDFLGVMDGEGEGFAGAAGDLAGQAMNWGMTVVGAITSLGIIVVLTLFLAARPKLYRQGAVRLVPPDHREMVDETLSGIAHALRWWFFGQLVSMGFLGITVGLGFLFLGVDLWLGLAVLTALLSAVPFIGPLIATVPIVAVGFSEGMQTGLIVLGGYLVIQGVESNLLMPIIQQKAVNLAPALLIAVQVLLGVVFGVMGLILAAPLTIVAMVAVQKLWVEHILGEKVA